jgi:hypothetical protein
VIVAAILIVWSAVAVGLCLALHRARQSRPAVTEPPEVVHWLPLLPPVPLPRHYSDDLLADVPAEILAVDERDRQFFAIVNAERWFVDGAA